MNNKESAPEKVRELAKTLADSKYRELKVEAEIAEWLEQNPIEPVVVGLSDRQIEGLSDFISDDEYRHTSKLRADVISEWLKTQTFTKPVVKEVVIGLSDEQLNQLFNYFPFKATLEEFVEGYQEWLKTQTSTQPCESLIADNLTLAKELEQMTKDRDRLFELHVEQLKSQQFTPDWGDIPPKIDKIAVEHLHYCNDEPIKHYTVHTFERPKPTPVVEVGQVWIRVFGQDEVTVIGINDFALAYQHKNGNFGTHAIRDFPAKFERVQP